MSVSDTHAEYDEYAPLWVQVRDCVKGSDAVKTRQAGNLKGDAYLPVPNSTDTSTENAARFASYLFRANYVNFTGHTKKGMIGMVFRKDAKIVLPEKLEYLKTNSNGNGLSLSQLIKAILGGVLETGRYGLFVEYPEVEAPEDDKGATKAEVDAIGNEANIQPYAASQIINWRTTVVGSVKKLSLVVLKEDVDTISDDGFSYKKETRHRVLKLVDNVYVQEIWGAEDTLSETITPTKADGTTWDEIPFIFVGSENNDETVDEAPLYDLSNINLAHYRNSADYEESSFFVGQPTPILIGLDENWAKKVLKGKVSFGSRGMIPLPEGGDAKLLQAEANQMPLEGMREKEKQMIKTGARLIQDATGDETAEAAKIRFSGQNSELAGIVGNIEDGLKKCAIWIGEYMAVDEEMEVEVNREFYDASMDAQQAVALIQFADRGDISQADVRGKLRRSGWIDSDKTDDEIDEDLDDLNLNLTDDDEKGLSTTGDKSATAVQTTDPALLELLAKLIEQNENKQTFIPAGETVAGEAATANLAPVITVEAPIVNVTLPEGLITLPENMVVVSVESPNVTVESPNINVEAQPATTPADRVVNLVFDAKGKPIGATSKVVT